MRHKKSKFQLNRFTSWRKATIISLARNLLIQQSIKTTLQRAKAVRPLIDKLISLAKSNSLAARRQAAKILNDHKAVSLLFTEIGPRFTKNGSGYTRIINLGLRQGDNAKMAILELTEIKKKEVQKPKKIKEDKTEDIEKKPAEIKKEPVENKREPVEEQKPKTEVVVKEKPPIQKKPSSRTFLGGIRNIFKKERDSL